MLPMKTFESHKDKAWFVAWNPTGTLLASCSSDKSINFLEKKDSWLSKNTITDAHTRTVRSLAWSPCGKMLASASFDATVNIWENIKGNFECIATLEGHENEIKSVSWSKCGHFLATCSRDKSVWIWEVGEDQEFDCMAVLTSHTQDVKKVVFHPEENVLASCSYDNTIKIYKEDGDDWSLVHSLEGHLSTVWSIDFNETGEFLASCSDDQTLKIWKNFKLTDSPWKCVCTLSNHHNRSIYDISWNKLNSTIATACGDDHIRIFKPSNDKLNLNLILDIPNSHSDDVNSVAWHPSIFGLLASASDDGSIKIWDLSAYD